MNESVLQASSPHSRALRELVTGARQFELNDVTVGKCVGTYDIMETHKGSYKGNKVMVKVIRGDLIRTAEVIRVIHLWCGVSHENIHKLLGFTVDYEGSVSLIQPWSETQNALQYVKGGRDPRPLLLGIAAGLDHLHTHLPLPIVHGDVRGENVLVHKGKALLTNIHTYFAFNARGNVKPKSSTRWQSPERLERIEHSTRLSSDDVWSFGMTTMELFTGEPPFHKIQEYELNAMVLGGTLYPPHTRYPLTDNWWDICKECWHAESGKRPKMSQVLEKIQNIAPAEVQTSCCCCF